MLLKSLIQLHFSSVHHVVKGWNEVILENNELLVAIIQLGIIRVLKGNDLFDEQIYQIDLIISWSLELRDKTRRLVHTVLVNGLVQDSLFKVVIFLHSHKLTSFILQFVFRPIHVLNFVYNSIQGVLSEVHFQLKFSYELEFKSSLQNIG